MSKGKLIENLSYEKLVHICNLTRRVDFSNIRINEKGISWDGDLVIYNSINEFENGIKSGREKRVPIQLKGKSYGDIEWKDTILYGLDTRDLKNYYNSSGCLVLVVLIMPNNKSYMYYNILSKSDIKELLQKEKRKHSVLFRKINNSIDFLNIVLKADYTFHKKKILSGRVIFNKIKPNETVSIEPTVRNNDGDDYTLIIAEETLSHEFQSK